MYDLKSIWNNESWDIHSSSYNTKDTPSSEDKKLYTGQKYNDGSSPGSVYSRNDGMKDETKKEEEMDTIATRVENELKKEEKNDGAFFPATDVFKPAQILHENMQHYNTDKKESKKSIEEAISKAIQQEKEVIILG